MKKAAKGWACLVIFSIATHAWAANPFPMPLPDFQVSQADGTTISTTHIPQSGKSFLVYTKPNCVSCDRFLRIFIKIKAENPVLPSHMVIVVSGAQPSKLSDFAAQFPELSDAGWYTDPSETGVAQLQIKGMPVIFALNNNTVVWSFLGIPSGDTARFKAILKSWLNS